MELLRHVLSRFVDKWRIGPARMLRISQIGQEIVFVPSRAFITVETIPQAFRTLHPNISVHGLLASFFAFGGKSKDQYRPWSNMWPSPQNFKDTMPLMWPQNLPKLNSSVQSPENTFATNSFLPFPPAIDGSWASPIPSNSRTRENVGLLHAQKERFEKDWAIVSASLPEVSVDNYTYHWLIVNTRSCYFEIPKTKVHLNRKDRMMLCPYIDMFNHADRGVSRFRHLEDVGLGLSVQSLSVRKA